MLITLPNKAEFINEKRTAKICFAITRFNVSVNRFIYQQLALRTRTGRSIIVHKF
jgi:hypothetical protein